MSKPQTIPELIDKWPTIAAFAADIGCGYEAARKMRDRGSIAPEHWAAVISAAKAEGISGVTYEWLASRRPAPAPKAVA